MKKIALINPASSFLVHDGDRPPLNLAYLATSVRQSHDIKIFDFSINNHLKLLREIRKYNPDIIGYTATTPTFPETVRLLKEISVIVPTAINVIGGVHATIMPKYCLKWFDYVIIGEADFSFKKFCSEEKPKDRIIKSDTIYKIDGLLPARDLLPMNKYNMQLDNEKCTIIITSRGCPYGCIYCSSIAGKRVRLNSAENVVNEIGDIMSKYNYRSFYFLDDIFTIDRFRVFEICRLIRERKLNIEFRITTRIDLVDKVMLNVLKASGCKMICYGLGSGSDRMLKFYNKKFQVQDIKRVVNMTKQVGIEIKGFWMHSKYENIEDGNDTDSLIKELNLKENGIYDLVVYPGSELWRREMKNIEPDIQYFEKLYHGGKNNA